VIRLWGMKSNLETVDDVIAALGGPKRVKELTCRESPSAVPMWKNRKRFPAKTFTTLQSALRDLGLSAPNDLWGMP
jgi:hypothetical protein